MIRGNGDRVVVTMAHRAASSDRHSKRIVPKSFLKMLEESRNRKGLWAVLMVHRYPGLSSNRFCSVHLRRRLYLFGSTVGSYHRYHLSPVIRFFTLVRTMKKFLKAGLKINSRWDNRYKRWKALIEGGDEDRIEMNELFDSLQKSAGKWNFATHLACLAFKRYSGCKQTRLSLSSSSVSRPPFFAFERTEVERWWQILKCLRLLH